MKFIASLEIFCFIVHFQLVESQLPIEINGTTNVKHDKETTAEEKPNNVHHYNKHKHVKPKQGESAESIEPYTFVALIEAMFIDGSRKYCTGAIIHDNVVITAAHCFEDELNSLEIELTGSFVIIGTKDMFNTGYEQYLPIERVLIHSDYKGWKADIALVYTFAGMMSDKPGNIIPLAEGNAFTSLYANVTALDWKQNKKHTSAKNVKSFLDSDCLQASDEKEKVNTLFMQDYTIIEIRSCKDLIQKFKPAIYQIENLNSTVCYYTRSLNKVQAYSGAPAVHHNHLVAIAAGDLNIDHKHIIVGTKLGCYCAWINENLPVTGGDQMQCCKNCCSEHYFKSNTETYY